MEKEKKPRFKSLVIEDVKYKTHFNRKFTERKPWEPDNPKTVRAFIPGTVLKVYVKEGQEVKEGDNLLVLEAMKMENEILAERDGIIKKVHVKNGMSVPKMQLMIEYE